MKNWSMNNVESLSDKTIVVTGANAGLGYETTLALAKKEAKVVMACRNASKAEKAKQEILKKAPKAKLEIMTLDLSSLKSVRAFANNFLKTHKRLDVLVNNAGVMIPPYSATEDNLELQMAANYFGHFVLTGLLLDVLNNTAGARIVMLSSKAHESGNIDFDNLNSEKSYSKMGAYSQSKLACLMHAQELNRRLLVAGSKIIAVAAHPGASNTDLARHTPKALYYILYPIIPLFTHKPENAVLPQLMAALDTDVQGGDYFGPTGFGDMKGKPGKVTAKPHAYIESVAKKLFDVSEKLTAFSYKF
ncbi:oxidoreductase [Ancylomarina sp. 16SWW S1-10-2]|uniref:oxidoreductase n=1 Tax=Ancylomarina sp. 16SWW S1-10-2 TaxID=2499681 RepID=UPI0012AEAC32|nr:oxidoreductase [Ancylomarina sp. 16SWW S1-10-2]MRT92895.1 SDR family NAD(P)-dependent oxidoreductase [Ancylomarina sp. 16SWW S1-10-2]